MPRSSRQQKRPQRYASQEDSEIETESEAESVSDYQATSNSEDEDDRASTPDSQKDSKCGVCKKSVNSSDKSLQCDTCSEWCHIKAGTFLVFSHLCVLSGSLCLHNSPSISNHNVISCYSHFSVGE